MDLLAKLISHRPMVDKAVLKDLVGMYRAMIEFADTTPDKNPERALAFSSMQQKTQKQFISLSVGTARVSTEAFELILRNEPTDAQFLNLHKWVHSVGYLVFHDIFYNVGLRRKEMRGRGIPNWNE